MRTSNMTEGVARASAHKNKKYIKPATEPAPTAAAALGQTLTEVVVLLRPFLLRPAAAACSVHSRNEQIVAITWCLPQPLAVPLATCHLPCPRLCVAYFLAPHCCRSCRTIAAVKVAGVLHAQRCVSTAYQTYPHPSACPLSLALCLSPSLTSHSLLCVRPAKRLTGPRPLLSCPFPNSS